MTPRCDMDLL